MWIADQWKDYEVIDCSSGEKLGAGKLYARSSGPSGHLEHPEERSGLEAQKRTLSPQ